MMGRRMLVKTIKEKEGEDVVVVERTGKSMMDLPTELHLLISAYLTYPDALSLKHTNRHFYSMVYTGVNLKIEWLIERRRLHLDCPHDRGCELGSDQRFCRGSVRLLMKRRREHHECSTVRGGRGCLVFSTPVCVHKRVLGRWEVLGNWVRGGFLVWWAVFATVGLVCAVLWARMEGVDGGVRSELRV